MLELNGFAKVMQQEMAEKIEASQFLVYLCRKLSKPGIPWVVLGQSLPTYFSTGDLLTKGKF